MAVHNADFTFPSLGNSDADLEQCSVYRRPSSVPCMWCGIVSNVNPALGVPVDHYAHVTRQMLMTRSSINSKLLLTQESHARGPKITPTTNANYIGGTQIPHLGSDLVHNEPIWVLHGMFDHICCVQAYREHHQLHEFSHRMFIEYCRDRLGIDGSAVLAAPSFLLRKEFGGSLSDCEYEQLRASASPSCSIDVFEKTRCVVSYQSFSLTVPLQLYDLVQTGSKSATTPDDYSAAPNKIRCAWCRMPFSPDGSTPRLMHHDTLAQFDRSICLHTYARTMMPGLRSIPTVQKNMAVALPPWTHEAYGGPFRCKQLQQLLGELEKGTIRFRMWPGVSHPVCISIAAVMDAYQGPDCFAMLPDGSAEYAKKKSTSAGLAETTPPMPAQQSGEQID